MVWAAIIGAGVGLYGAEQQKQAQKDALAAQQTALGQSGGLYSQQYQQLMQMLGPWLQAGKGALTAQQQLMGLAPGYESQLAALQASPGYQFRLQQGQQGLESGLAARGGMGSGRSMQAGIDYNQNFASNEYANRLAQLAGLSGMGQQAAGTIGGAGMGYAQGLGNLLQSGANAFGAARMGGVNATQSSLLGGANLGLGLYNAWNQPNQNQQYQQPADMSQFWAGYGNPYGQGNNLLLTPGANQPTDSSLSGNPYGQPTSWMNK